MNDLRRHYKAVSIGIFALFVLIALISMERKRSLSAVTSLRLQDNPRSEQAASSDFYSEQLSEEEKEDWLFMKGRIEKLQGGVVTLPYPVTGKQYLRISSVLENEGNNYFYGFYDVPMTEDGRYVKHKNSDILTVTEPEISKVILFLSCAKGIELSGQYADDGTVTNLEEVNQGLSANEEEKVEEIRKTQETTQETVQEILDGLADDCGEKTAVDYFLQWLDDNMTFASNIGGDAGEVSNMGEVLESIYVYNQLSALTQKKGTALGYAKILAELCNRAGMESHIVLGKWKGNFISSESYVLCAVSMDDQTIYVDASGAKSSVLAGERYMSETEALNHMEFVSYFDYTE